ncbi:MAG: hypothetical protein ACD_44C00100G0002 [uncultured bacterium]|nr:MAG: hypothetical protein ACD_44C00100G0002 [uncultured bacterium]
MYHSCNMQGYFLTEQPFLRIFFLEPGAILFGCLLMLMSAALVLVFLIKLSSTITNVLIGFLILIHLTLDGILAFDLIGNVTHVYTDTSTGVISELFSTHRWLLIQIPILYTLIALLLAFVCKGHEKESHAKTYVFAMQFCVVVSFFTILLIGYESLI